MIRDRFGGEVPASLEELTSLPGVGRKTANVIRGHIFNDPSIVVDTHVKRISGLLGLTKSDKPEEVGLAGARSSKSVISAPLSSLASRLAAMNKSSSSASSSPAGILVR